MSTILGSPLSLGGGGAKIGVTLNEDGTQNLFLTDNNTVLNLLVGTEDATATPADVASGKTFYAQGQKKTGTATMEPAVTEPVLLWTNTNPNAEFAAQTLQLDMSNYGGALIEAGSLNWGVIDANAKTINYVRKQDGYQGLGSVRAGTISSGSYSKGTSYGMRDVIVSDAGLQFMNGYQDNGTQNNARIIPTRIWGVKFTLN